MELKKLKDIEKNCLKDFRKDKNVRVSGNFILKNTLSKKLKNYESKYILKTVGNKATNINNLKLNIVNNNFMNFTKNNIYILCCGEIYDTAKKSVIELR